jgi:hypothetical protein
VGSIVRPALTVINSAFCPHTHSTCRLQIIVTVYSDVYELCFLCGKNWILKYYLGELRLQRVKRGWKVASANRTYKWRKEKVAWMGADKSGCAYARHREGVLECGGNIPCILNLITRWKSVHPQRYESAWPSGPCIASNCRYVNKLYPLCLGLRAVSSFPSY